MRVYIMELGVYTRFAFISFAEWLDLGWGIKGSCGGDEEGRKEGRVEDVCLPIEIENWRLDSMLGLKASRGMRGIDWHF